MPLLLNVFQKFFLLVVAGWMLAGDALAASADSRAQGPTGRALLIGINKYQNVPHLRGSHNDIEAMRQILMTRFGFPEARIRILKDQQATRAGILAAFERLVGEASPQDMVVVHFAGHGSQVQDLNGDEEDGLDETIIPYDGRTDGVPDILDDQLDEIFSRLKSRAVMIVLDSCHSGTATRGVQITTRSVPQDTRIGLYPKPAIGTRGVVPLHLSARYVLMTGAASHQAALDGPIDGKFHGFFSYALSRSLGSAPQDATPRQVFDGAERELKRVQAQLGLSSMPEPQLEAPLERMNQPLIATTRDQSAANPVPVMLPGEVRLPWVELHPTGADRGLLVNGIALGAAPGSLWAVYPPGETAFIPGRGLALARVIELKGPDAVVIVEAAASPLLAGSRAVALAPPAPGGVPVRFVNIPPERRARLEAALRQRLGDLAIVGAGEFARFVVEAEGNVVRVTGADGRETVASIPISNDSQLAESLAALFIRSRNASELMSLDNPSSQIRLSVRVASDSMRTRGTEEHSGTRGIIVVADTTSPQYRIRRAAEPRTPGNSLQLEIQTNLDCFLTIVDVDSEGSVNLLFPNPHQKSAFHSQGRVQGSRAILLPDALQSGNQAGFHWDYSPPPGIDTIRVFASTDLATAEMIRGYIRQPQVVAMNRNTSPAGGSGGGFTAGGLGKLRYDLARVSARGLIVVPDMDLMNTQSSTQPTSNAAGESAGQPVQTPAGSSAGLSGTQLVGSGDWTAASLTVRVDP